MAANEVAGPRGRKIATRKERTRKKRTATATAITPAWAREGEEENRGADERRETLPRLASRGWQIPEGKEQTWLAPQWEEDEHEERGARVGGE